MAYIGNTPALNFISFAKQVFTIVNSQTAYTLDHKVTNENDIRLVINNVVQEPGSGKAYTASGTTLTLSAALTNGTDEMYCVFLGKAVQTVNPPNASVGTAQLADSSVTSAKLASGAVANTPAFLARNDAAQSISANTTTKVTFGTEEYDTDSAFASSKFTVPSGKAGKYFIYSKVQQDTTSNTHLQLKIYKNGSEIGRTFTAEADNDEFTSWSGAIDLSASDYIEIYILQNSDGSGAARDVRTGGSLLYTYFGGYKLVE